MFNYNILIRNKELVRSIEGKQDQIESLSRTLEYERKHYQDLLNSYAVDLSESKESLIDMAARLVDSIQVDAALKDIQRWKASHAELEADYAALKTSTDREISDMRSTIQSICAERDALSRAQSELSEALGRLAEDGEAIAGSLKLADLDREGDLSDQPALIPHVGRGIVGASPHSNDIQRRLQQLTRLMRILLRHCATERAAEDESEATLDILLMCLSQLDRWKPAATAAAAHRRSRVREGPQSRCLAVSRDLEHCIGEVVKELQRHDSVLETVNWSCQQRLEELQCYHAQQIQEMERLGEMAIHALQCTRSEGERTSFKVGLVRGRSELDDSVEDLLPFPSPSPSPSITATASASACEALSAQLLLCLEHTALTLNATNGRLESLQAAYRLLSLQFDEYGVLQRTIQGIALRCQRVRSADYQGEGEEKETEKEGEGEGEVIRRRTHMHVRGIRLFRVVAIAILAANRMKILPSERTRLRPVARAFIRKESPRMPPTYRPPRSSGYALDDAAENSSSTPSPPTALEIGAYPGVAMLPTVQQMESSLSSSEVAERVVAAVCHAARPASETRQRNRFQQVRPQR